MDYPRLETERLILRWLQIGDADFILKEWGDLEVTYYMRDEEPLKTREQAEEMLRHLQKPKTYHEMRWWGIGLKPEGNLIGTIGYYKWDKPHHHAEVGYDMWPDYWGQGLMPEALRVVVQYGFEEMELNRIEATTHTENQRSQRVLAKLGFQNEGVLREYYCRDGIYNDQIQFSLLRREWKRMSFPSKEKSPMEASFRMTQAQFPKNFPRIETERLILREISQDDTTAIFRNFSNPDISRWFFKQPHTEITQTAQFIEQFISDFKQGKGLTWAITLKDNGNCIGTCGYGEVEIGDRGEIGFDLAKENWGKGLMIESLKAVINYGLTVLKLSKIEAHTYLDNIRARRLLEKLGFELDYVSEDSANYLLVAKNWRKHCR